MKLVTGVRSRVDAGLGVSDFPTYIKEDLLLPGYISSKRSLHTYLQSKKAQNDMPRLNNYPSERCSSNHRENICLCVKCASGGHSVYIWVSSEPNADGYRTYPHSHGSVQPRVRSGIKFLESCPITTPSDNLRSETTAMVPLVIDNSTKCISSPTSRVLCRTFHVCSNITPKKTVMSTACGPFQSVPKRTFRSCQSATLSDMSCCCATQVKMLRRRTYR